MDEFRFKVLLALQLCAAAGLLTFIVFWGGEWNAQHWLALILAVPATVLMFVARFQLGRSFAIRAEARQLVTAGIYSKIRNPIYVFSAILVVAIALAARKPQLLAILVILIPLQIMRARREARVLEAKFGDEYRRYRQQTWF